ncbi:SMI1/KNR4 family protein [Acinetobacter higginsii]|uniref:SMI1/KNR4 family protein n=1 Tax=Acinetobacter higginsii TaxID=70347 RepID=UPI001F4B6A40|nr:SMI1/KNR4 family protein [Acinetobacter higginsii]MCH7296933.1 SMI1/KNR4 family protein [Acinetobacter higginsii]
MYEYLKKLIEESNILHQGSKGDVEVTWIDEAENKLGYKLPLTYRWWLLEYGSGFLDGFPIYTLAPPDFRMNADADLLYADKINRLNGMTKSGRLYFYEPDGDQRFFFDMDEKVGDLDNPVMVEDIVEQEIKEYGGNFLFFLEKEIRLRKY